jgi:hypothetical protein
VASELGVARLSISGDRVGRASLLERCTATSVATDSERVLAGTIGGVLAGPGLDRLGEPFEVAAVGVGSQLLAAGNDGVVSVWEGVDGWNAVGSVDAPARFDGPLLAAEDGVYRVTSGCEMSPTARSRSRPPPTGSIGAWRATGRSNTTTRPWPSAPAVVASVPSTTTG